MDRGAQELLRHVGDVPAYLALCESAGGIGAEECDAVATMLDRDGDPAGALGWVERGLKESGDRASWSTSGFELRKRRRDLLVRQGRRAEAIAAAWSEFEEHPSVYRYDDLMDLLPEPERREWRDRAMLAGESADFSSAVELFLEAHEQDRLIRRVSDASEEDVAGLPFFVAEAVAVRLSTSAHGQAARLYCSLALPILRERKSRLYTKALLYLEGARDCYLAGGQVGVWEALVDEIRQAHRRKTGFMSHFERIVAGGPAVPEVPSMVERARQRWIKGSTMESAD